MEKVWDKATQIETSDDVFLLIMEGSGAGHCVICYGAESGSWDIDGILYSRRLFLADPNCIVCPNYVYLTEKCDNAIYRVWNEKNETYEAVWWNPTKFGMSEFGLNTALLDKVGIPEKMRTGENVSKNAVLYSEELYQEEDVTIISFYNTPSCTVSSENGVLVIQNGVVTQNTLEVQVHTQTNITENNALGTTSFCYAIFPEQIEYEISASADSMLDLSVSYGDSVYGINGDVKEIKLCADQSLVVLDSTDTFNIDVVDNESAFDFVSISGRADNEITVAPSVESIDVDGDWENCTVSHMTRNLDKVSMDVSGNPNLMLSMDESEELVAYTDTDGNGTYETRIDTVMRVRVLDEEKTATIEAVLPEDGAYLIFAQYDTNGKQLCTELVKADESGKVYHTVALEDGAEIFKGFILDTNWSPLKEAIVEIV